MLEKLSKDHQTLLAEETGESYRIVSGRADSGLVLLCDHAENTVPEPYGNLGLPASQFERHIAFDIGAKGVTEQLASLLNVPAVLSRFSRLLIDPNRGSDDPTLVMRLSDGAVVPGNAGVDEAERNRRIAGYYEPYHQAIARTIDAALATGVVPAILSIHSFTPDWKGVPRKLHAGVLWQEGERRLVDPLIDGLARDPALIVADNEPYRGGLAGDTLDRHGQARGLAHALLEIRQDLIHDEEGIRSWAKRLAEILPDIMSEPDLHRIVDRQDQHQG